MVRLHAPVGTLGGQRVSNGWQQPQECTLWQVPLALVHGPERRVVVLSRAPV